MDVARVVQSDLDAIGMWPPGERVMVGVSGGADSVCLLHVLLSLQVPVVVAHLDHGLRRSSWSDARHVLRLASALGVPAVADRLGAGHWRAGEGSLEDRARRARYRFLADAARAADCRLIAVGHTQDDQAETVLLHLVRGSGSRGLRGMLPACSLADVTGNTEDSGLLLLRPLLNVARAETFAHCRAARLPVRRDPTNDQPVFLRNRVRLELLPLLEQYNPAIRQSLAHLADILAGDAEAIDSAVMLLAQQIHRSPEGNRAELARAWMLGLPVGLQRAVLLGLLRDLAPQGAEIGFLAIERARAGIVSGMRTSLPGNVELRTDGDRLIVSPHGMSPALPPSCPQWTGPEAIALLAPAAIPLAGGWMLEAVEREVATPIENLTTDPRIEVLFDAEAISKTLILRTAVAGDRMIVFGAQGSKKVSDLFQQERVPITARPAWPIVGDTSSIVWLVGIRRAEGARVGPQTRRVLHLRLRAPASQSLRLEESVPPAVAAGG